MIRFISQKVSIILQKIYEDAKKQYDKEITSQ